MNFFVYFNLMLTTGVSKPIKTVALVVLLIYILSIKYFVKMRKIIWCEGLYHFLVFQFGVSTSQLLESAKQHQIYTLTLLKLV